MWWCSTAIYPACPGPLGVLCVAAHVGGPTVRGLPDRHSPTQMALRPKRVPILARPTMTASTKYSINKAQIITQEEINPNREYGFFNNDVYFDCGPSTQSYASLVFLGMHASRKVQSWQKVSHLLEQEYRVVTHSNG